MKKIIIILLLYVQTVKAQDAVHVMYEDPNKLVLRCVTPRAWEYAELCSQNNHIFIPDSTLSSILINLGQDLQDTTIAEYVYTGVELVAVCEKKGYGYDVLVCGAYDGDLVELNGKPRKGGQLIKNLLYYTMYMHLTLGQPSKMSEEAASAIIERYKEWSAISSQELPSVTDMFHICPSWIPDPPQMPHSLHVEE